MSDPFALLEEKATFWKSVNKQDYMTSDLYRDIVDAKLRELNERIRMRYGNDYVEQGKPL